MYTVPSIMFLIFCLSNVNLLSLRSTAGPCKLRSELKSSVVTPNAVAPLPKPEPELQFPLDTYIRIKNKASGLCLEAELANGQNYHMSVCKDTDRDRGQKFNVKQNGVWWNIFAFGNALVFENSGAMVHDGNFYWNWSLNKSPGQNFKMPMTNGFFTIINQASNKCVANPQGMVVEQRTCNGNDNQLFSILK